MTKFGRTAVRWIKRNGAPRDPDKGGVKTTVARLAAFTRGPIMNISNTNYAANPYALASAPVASVSPSQVNVVPVDTFSSAAVVASTSGTAFVDGSAAVAPAGKTWMQSIKDTFFNPFAETAAGYTTAVLCMVGAGVFGGPVAWGILAGLALFGHGCYRMTQEVRAAQQQA